MLRIVESVFIKSAVYPKDYPESELPEVAFVGKSNVGKSSMINTVLGRKAIAKISSTPGKTRLINFFNVRFKDDPTGENSYINFVDLPGYGYAKVSKTERNSWQKMVEKYFANRDQLKGVIALIDIRHKADPKDLVMIQMLKIRNIPFMLAATKSDKIPKSKVGNVVRKLAVELQVDKDDIIAFSALKKSGISTVIKWIGSRID